MNKSIQVNQTRPNEHLGQVWIQPIQVDEVK